MTSDNPNTSSTAPIESSVGLVAQPASEAAVPRTSRTGLWLAVLALVLAVVSTMLAVLMWQKLDFTRKEVARRSQEGEVQSAETRSLAAQADAQVKEIQARLAVAEVKLSEVSLQRSQLEELMLALSRSRDDNLVQDLESALRLAQQQTELTGSVQPLLVALQSADERIARAAQPRLNPVQRAIARDIQHIRSTTVADVPSLVQRLDELARQVDRWPVPNDVRLQTPAVRKAPPAQPVASEPVSAPAEPAASGWNGLSQAWTAFWIRLWDETTRTSRELVRVSRIDRPEAVLLAPEQAFFLRENLKLRLLNARLGLLARQMDAVQDDLKTIDAALGRQFDTSAVDVIAAQAVVTQLRAELANTQLPRPEESLSALAVAAGGR